uniref:Uncharacterized protein n=1 Tax=Medicago truncatula TaxID=3880 RepID=I3T730_MEDTR|nr:unknown [Medicago truncatula]
MSFLSVFIWSVGRRKMCPVRHLKLLGLPATNTCQSLQERMHST